MVQHCSNKAPKTALVRILRLRDQVSVGTGCYAGEGLIVTCAHVVCAGFDIKKEERSNFIGKPPTGRIGFAFPFLQNPNNGERTFDFTARVAFEGWGWEKDLCPGNDLAILRLIEETPEILPILFSESNHLNESIDVVVHGFSPANQDGNPVDGTLTALGNLANGCRVLRFKNSTFLLEPGYSGAPALIKEGNEAAGLFIGMPEFSNEEQRHPDEAAYVIPSAIVAKLLDVVRARSREVPPSSQHYESNVPVYAGLATFTPDMAHLFFGRKSDIEDFTGLLTQHEAKVIAHALFRSPRSLFA